MLVSINLPYRPEGDPIELVGIGLFPNGGVYEVDIDGEDIIVGEPLSGSPVKVEDTVQLSEAVKFLMELTDEELDALAEDNKVTFGDDMTKQDKATALESSGVELQEGDD